MIKISEDYHIERYNKEQNWYDLYHSKCRDLKDGCFVDCVDTDVSFNIKGNKFTYDKYCTNCTEICPNDVIDKANFIVKGMF